MKMHKYRMNKYKSDEADNFKLRILKLFNFQNKVASNLENLSIFYHD